MNAAAPRGWCPSLFAPMQSGDGLLLRVKPPGGVLTAEAARSLAVAATRYGNGVIELGNRASVQLRGFQPDGVALFATAMVRLGLAEADPAAEARRTVIAPPLAGDDPAASPHAMPLATALAALLVAEPRFAVLPAKFGSLVDGGGVLPLGAVAADLTMTLTDGVCHVGIDGTPLGVACDPAVALEVARRLLLAFVTRAPRCAKPPRRMRGLVAELGAEAVFAAAGFVAAPLPLRAAPAARAGWLPYGTSGRGGFAAGLPFGATDAATLTGLADLAEQFGGGSLRVTPWRAFAIPGVTAPDALRAGLERLGLITDPADPRTHISACPGSPACASASMACRALATSLAALSLPGTLHVSGCGKGCAHPGPADFTVTGGADGYSLIRHATASGVPLAAGLTATALHDLLLTFGKGASV